MLTEILWVVSKLRIRSVWATIEKNEETFFFFQKKNSNKNTLQNSPYMTYLVPITIFGWEITKNLSSNLQWFFRTRRVEILLLEWFKN